MFRNYFRNKLVSKTKKHIKGGRCPEPWGTGEDGGGSSRYCSALALASANPVCVAVADPAQGLGPGPKATTHSGIVLNVSCSKPG